MSEEKKKLKEYQKIVVRLQSLNLVINKIVFHYINLTVHGNHLKDIVLLLSKCFI